LETRSYKLAACRFPGNSSEHPASAGWFATTWANTWMKDDRISDVIPLRLSDTPISMSRNNIVWAALEHGADYILMLDSDMKPDCEPDGKPFWSSSWDFMMEYRAREEAYASNMRAVPWTDDSESIETSCRRLYPPATIAAPYCGPPPWEVVYMMKWVRDETNSPTDPRPYHLEMFDRDHAADFTGIFEVAAMATGLILYDARVFKELPPPWFYYEYEDKFHKRKVSTEDIVQTRNASLLGLPQYCNWDSWAAHIKLKSVRKPRKLDVSAVPNAFADAVRKGTRGNHKVVIVGDKEDQFERPRIVRPGYPDFSHQDSGLTQEPPPAFFFGASTAIPGLKLPETSN
jgi:hypothetical protein